MSTSSKADEFVEPLSTFFAGLKALAKPVIYVARIFTDQTRLEILLPRSQNPAPDTASVYNQTGEAGLFYFGVTTAAKHEVEILEIRLAFPPPLELMDPGNEGFFHLAASTDPKLQFELSWSGSVIVKKGLIQCFGVEAHFRDHIVERRISLTFVVRRQVREVGGFISERRRKRIVKNIRLRLTEETPLGILSPANSVSQFPQPYMRRAPRDFVGEANLLRISYIDAAGRPQTRVVPTRPDRPR